MKRLKVKRKTFDVVTLLHGDCLKLLKKVPNNSVDFVLTDPPYGTTKCKWDAVIPLKPMWRHLKRVVKKNSMIVMTATQPFTSKLVCSNLDMFKYSWVWEKSIVGGFFNAHSMPLKTHEDVCVFGCSKDRNNWIYNPQGVVLVNKVTKRGRCKREDHVFGSSSRQKKVWKADKENFPRSILKVNSVGNQKHPTEKPVALMEYLINTYTKKGQVVLDFAMGSGTTGVAARRLDRTFVGIEIRKDYFQLAKQRIKDVEKQIERINYMFDKED